MMAPDDTQTSSIIPEQPDPQPILEPETDDEHGRVGYGRYERLTPIGLGLLILGALVFIVLDRRGDDASLARDLVGEPAPAIAAMTWDGRPLDLADPRGEVVVLNFWAEWCVPCREEMPAMQRIAARRGDVTIVGVNLKSDYEENARRLVRELGITYPIVRDDGGTNQRFGEIELAYGLNGSYPVTVFVRPDGTIDAIRIGEMDEAEIEERIDSAAS